MLAWLWRRFALLVVLADLHALAALVAPDAFPYLDHVLSVVYFAGTWLLIKSWGAVHHFRFRAFWQLRVAHGIEHATLNVLEVATEGRFGGYTQGHGFVVYLPLDFEEPVSRVRAAAEEAIARVQQGETDLVYSQECGTGTDVARLAFAAAIVVPGIAARALQLPAALALGGLVLAHHIWAASAPFLRILVQRYFTVSTEADSIQVESARLMKPPVHGWQRVAVDLKIARN